MRIIMFGTGPFAVPTFQSLLESDHDVPALVTRPIADAGKRRKSAANPTRDAGEAAGINILNPEDVNIADSVAALLAFDADLFVVCDYGQIMSKACLSAARLGGINLHGSLLPKYRGAAPINHAILNGDETTGVTVIHMSPRLDAGPCLSKAEMPIGPDDTTETLEPQLARLGVGPVIDAISVLAEWDGESPIGEIQDRSLATKAPRLKKSDGRIDWTQSAIRIRNQIRAYQPWPGSFAIWVSMVRGKQKQTRLIIHAATVIDEADHSGNQLAGDKFVSENTAGMDTNTGGKLVPEGLSPGQVAISNAGALAIKTGDGFLSIELIQPADKNPMPIADFLRGKQPGVGDSFTG